MENRHNRLQLEDGPTMTEYATTLSVITFFCVSMVALAAAVGYLT